MVIFSRSQYILNILLNTISGFQFSISNFRLFLSVFAYAPSGLCLINFNNDRTYSITTYKVFPQFAFKLVDVSTIFILYANLFVDSRCLICCSNLLLIFIIIAMATSDKIHLETKFSISCQMQLNRSLETKFNISHQMQCLYRINTAQK